MTTNKILKSLFIFLLFTLVSCDHNMVIINDVDEREANEIIVFLASRGISSEKMQAVSTGAGTTGNEAVKWSIIVDGAHSTKAMAILNQNGLPRKKGTSLLDLFAKAGLMSSEKEETIRYQAGLAEQIANMIRKIDGVLDADVQISFPSTETSSVAYGSQQEKLKKITAAVYVKHQGIFDDPNAHLSSKIKRLVSGSVTGLDLNDVTVISDRARFIDVSLTPISESLEGAGNEYVSIWSIILNKHSASRFRIVFFLMMFCLFIFALFISWMIWKFYPFLKEKGNWRNLLKIAPFKEKEGKRESSENES
ncbi:MAG: type secretion protein [Chlamydiota bacterium]|nr:type secretion protein [Chlamydiota bacterium]